MPIPVTVAVTTETISAKSLGAEPTEFNEWIPSGNFESVKVGHDAGKLLPKEKKELAAFCAFAGNSEFQEVIARLAGSKPGSVLKVMILSSAKNEDPPDVILAVGKKSVRIEVTDCPPDQEGMLQAMAEHSEAAPLPLFHESGCSPDLIKQFMEAGGSLTEPHVGELSTEILALYDYARVTIGKKDASGKSELLLLYGPVAFEHPEVDVIGYVVANTVFKSLKAVVFVRQNKCSVYWTNLA